jgi:hypothetical protein
VIYELWDVGSANLIDSFDSEDAALAMVRSTIGDRGRRMVRLWALTMKNLDQDGQTSTLAQGATLADRATPTAGK